MSKPLIGSRLQALREELGFSQDQLAGMLDFKDRQFVSAVETGTRRLSAEELVLAMEKLVAPLEHFTDPFRLVGEGRFSWRHTGVSAERLSGYERDAGRWIAAYRTLAPRFGREPPLMRRSLRLDRHSSPEDAMLAGERFAREFDLGEVPATNLVEVMERKLGILVLMTDAFEGVCGGVCRLPELDTVLIARREAPGRRNFDLARELFHILTWDSMPPERSEEAKDAGGRRVQRLANRFAAAVLIPAAALKRHEGWDGLGESELIARLNAMAKQLRVTASALRWRLVALGQLKPAAARSLPEAALRNDGNAAAADAIPALYSAPFTEVLARAVDEGFVSARRAAGLLDLTLDDLAVLFATHGVESPAEL